MDAPPPVYDYVVVGIGGIGSSTLYWLSKLHPRARILGLEQFELGHTRGGSQDFSRIIWEEAEDESGVQLVYKTGGMGWTTPDSGEEPWVREIVRVMKSAGESLTIISGAYDPDAGLVDAAMGNSVHQQLAEYRGAVLKDNAKVYGIQKTTEGLYKIETSKGLYLCRKITVTAGAWINEILSNFGVHIPVKVTQEQVSYIATPHLKYFTKEKFPVLIYASPEDHIYSLPVHGLAAFKVGVDAQGNKVTGDTRTFIPDPNREKKVLDFVAQYIPKASGRIKETKTCLYTMTYDRDFVVDKLKASGHPNVTVCCGAGHAYKMASILGKTLAEIAIFGKSQTITDLSRYSLDRPAITDPNFQPTFLHGAAHLEKSKI